MIEYKEQGWTPYGKKTGRFLAIGVKDKNKQTIESFELEKGKEIDNQRKLRKIKAYGFDLTGDEFIDEEKEEVKEDIDWLGKGKW